MFVVTLNKKETKVFDNLKVIHHLVELLLFSNVHDFLLSLKTEKKHVQKIGQIFFFLV